MAAWWRPPAAARGRILAAIAATTLLVAAGPVHGGADDYGWHVIRPGDTLEGLSIQFLGSADRWEELHRLNPRILDPHWIYPGRRVKVPVARPSERPNARVTALSNRVEARPEPVEWIVSEPGDLLLERDGLRTYANSSARLLFDDGTEANVSEDSLVFIRRQTSARNPAPLKEIEIEVGQAEFEAKATPDHVPVLEILVGGTRSESRPQASGTLRTKQRRTENDAVEVMLYEGEARVEAPAGEVALAPGTGTRVDRGGAPAAPIRLLSAPRLTGPPDDFEIAVGAVRPVLGWEAVAGAEAYLVEICGDRACGAVLERAPRVEGTRYRPQVPFRGVVYWRVSAVGGSGLDGFPSEVRSLRPRLLIINQ